MPEIIFTPTSNAAQDRQIRRLAADGKVRRLHSGIYTTNLHDTSEAIVRRSIWQILGRLLPGSVVSARSAAIMQPAFKLDGTGKEIPPGFVFLTGKTRRSLSLPGIDVRVASGPGPLTGDTPFVGLHLASPARNLLENLQPTRDRSGMARGTGRAAVEAALVRHCDVAGEERLNEIRDQARILAPQLGAEREFEILEGIIGALLRTREQQLVTPAGRALAQQEPIDTACVERFNLLFAHLRAAAMPRRLDRGAGTPAVSATAFIEAYFSNYIEGTRFLVDEAREIVFSGVVPERRPEDRHDVLATFAQLSAIEDMCRQHRTFEEFERSLLARHSQLMHVRPDKSPGAYKTRGNRAGNTTFVEPTHVRGTLREGFALLSALTDPMARAMFVHFMVSDVHPFVDGNGRISRILMTAELVRGNLARIVIPTVYRDDYLGGLRALSQHSDPAPMVRCLDRAQSIVADIVETDVQRAIEAWATTHAFVEAGPHARLTPYNPAIPIEWERGVPAPRSYWEALKDASSSPGLSF